MASMTASVWVSRRSGIHVVETKLGGARVGRVGRSAHGRGHVEFHLGMQRLQQLNADATLEQTESKQVERVFHISGRSDIGAIRLVVAGPVAAPAPGSGFDQRRAVARARAGD